MDDDSERDAWMRLALAKLPARVKAADLAERYGGAPGVLRASQADLAAGHGAARARAVRRALRAVDPNAVRRSAAEAGQSILTPADPRWPHAALEGVTEPPCALFLRGSLPARDDPCVAIVGTRDATPYGMRAAREIAAGLVEAGVWVVSGFAVGIDGAAHEAALEAGGSTLAVLGCGIDFDYPIAHGDLKEDVAADGGGGLLSEHPPGTAPQKWHFPRRNRLVAALSQAVVVVEAAGRSGALITARLALDQGREVLAVPGSVFGANRSGCHRLLRQGAGLCESAADVLELLGLSAARTRARRAPPRTEPEALLWSLLDDTDALDAGALCGRTGLPAAEVAAALTALELDGYVQRLPGVGFLRR